MRVPRLDLLRKFSLLSFVSVLGFCVALGALTARALTRNMLEAEWQSTAELIRYQVRAYGLERLFTPGPLGAEPARARPALSSLLDLPEVVRVKVWDRHGTVVWATDPRIVGQAFPDNPVLRQALAGQVAVELKRLGRAEHAYEREQYTELAEVYVPIFSRQNTAEVIGVLEVYKLPARLFGAIRGVTATVWGVALAGGIGLYLSLFGIVRVASRSQRELEQRLQERSEQLEERNRTLQLFLQTNAHDLKASMVAIHGLAGRLLEEYAEALDAEGQRLLHRLQANAEFQDRLLADLQTLGRVGREDAPLLAIDVTLLVREVVEERSTHLGAWPLKVTVPDSLPPIRGNAHELRSVFGHLIANAIAFMGDQPAPEIRVAGAGRGEEVEFSVADNGVGIDAAYHGKIFEAFERLDAAEAGGTGVGLTIARKIVEGVGGRIWVESAPGRGATFRFTVPKVWPQPRRR